MSKYGDVVVKHLGVVLGDKDLFVAYPADFGTVLGWDFYGGNVEESHLSAISFSEHNKVAKGRLRLNDTEVAIGSGFSAASALDMYELKLKKRMESKLILAVDYIPTEMDLAFFQSKFGENILFVPANHMPYENSGNATAEIVLRAESNQCSVVIGDFPGCLAAHIASEGETSAPWAGRIMFFCRNGSAPMKNRWELIA